ncbi:NAD(P)-binding protein [Pholiota conissans]|uniref:NAD(P)-binding protein n=1 Tax=Pholiota conissans TaxID=109636 RepID=A0A9P5YVG0_9AGAR|nr:NAD(P)-binding protein [Pholiota conissans]
MSDRDNTIFLLGATGFIGSQFLARLARTSHKFHVIALLRNITDEKTAKIKEFYPDIEFVEGTLTDKDIIVAQVARAKYVMNFASSDHPVSVQNILTGLESQSAANPGNPPLYLHTSGLCIVGDNARGEPVDEAKIPRYNDTTFTVDSVPVDNCHVNCDSLIIEAGTRKESPVRTIIMFPAWVYGLGEGYRKSSGGVRLFLEANKIAGYSGTWGPGANSFAFVHIKDLADGMIRIFEAALEGKADEGAQGYYFLASDHPHVTWKEYTAQIGDMLHKRGIYPEGGSKPYPTAVTDLFGEFGWKLLGGNHRVTAERLKKLGWEATESKKVSLLESLPEEVDMAFFDLQPKGSILRPEDE